MKTEKWKKVKIKDPRLRQLRKNLRTILKLAIEDRIRHLKSIEDLYFQKRIEGKLTPSQWKRDIALYHERDELRYAYNKSFLKCSMAGMCKLDKEPNSLSLTFIDKDMGWNPLIQEWICSTCYDYYFGTVDLREDFKRKLEKEKVKHWPSNKFHQENPLSKEEIKRDMEYFQRD